MRPASQTSEPQGPPSSSWCAQSPVHARERSRSPCFPRIFPGAGPQSWHWHGWCPECRPLEQKNYMISTSNFWTVFAVEAGSAKQFLPRSRSRQYWGGFTSLLIFGGILVVSICYEYWREKIIQRIKHKLTCVHGPSVRLPSTRHAGHQLVHPFSESFYFPVKNRNLKPFETSKLQFC